MLGVWRASFGFVLSLAMVLSLPAEVRGQVTPADIDAGRQLFQKNCALCHGGNATGGRGPDLTRGFFRRAANDAQLMEVVQVGILEAGMPWTGLSDQSAGQVIAYIRSLTGRGQPVTGDPGAGREIFFGKGTCNTCHMVHGEGSRQGPDLSWIGWRRAPDFLRESILDPNVDIDPRWWTAAVQTRTGNQITGILVDEDQFNLRILDEMDRLHALPKQELSSVERIKISKMPAFEGVLTEGELQDVVAYLAGLRGRETDR